MLTISNSTGGRFGNNLFQYIASKIVQHILLSMNQTVEYTLIKQKSLLIS